MWPISGIQYTSGIQYFYPIIIFRQNYLPDVPTSKELLRDIESVFVSSHWCIDYPKQFPPNIEYIGCFYCGNPSTLPTAIEKWVRTYVFLRIQGKFTKYRMCTNYPLQASLHNGEPLCGLLAELHINGQLGGRWPHYKMTGHFVTHFRYLVHFRNLVLLPQFFINIYIAIFIK